MSLYFTRVALAHFERSGIEGEQGRDGRLVLGGEFVQASVNRRLEVGVIRMCRECKAAF